MTSTTTTYGYDFFSRLLSAAKSGTSYAYGYDNNSNMTTATLNGTSLFSGTPSYNNANQLTALGTTAFTYDSNGNQQSGAAGALVYNFKNQTTSITPTGGSAFNMTYAGDSQVQRVTAGTATYKNDSLGIGSETNGGTTTYYTRTPGGGLVDERIVSGGTTTPYYYLFDGLGSVVALVDTSATVQDTYSYDPYGTVTATGTVANPWQYTGGYYDSTTKLVKLGQRFYDPSLGRFAQLDPKGGGYAYASDNPVNFTDQSGLCDPEDCGGQEPIDPFKEPPDPAKIDPSNPPEGYPEINFNSSHIFDRTNHGFSPDVDQGAVTQRISEDVYRRYQIGEVPQSGFFKNTTDIYMDDRYQPLTYQAYVQEGGNVDVGTAYIGYSNR